MTRVRSSVMSAWRRGTDGSSTTWRTPSGARDAPGDAPQLVDPFVLGRAEPGLPHGPLGAPPRPGRAGLRRRVHHPVHGLLVVAREGAPGTFRPLQHGPGAGHARRVSDQVDV